MISVRHTVSQHNVGATHTFAHRHTLTNACTPTAGADEHLGLACRLIARGSCLIEFAWIRDSLRATSPVSLMSNTLHVGFGWTHTNMHAHNFYAHTQTPPYTHLHAHTHTHTHTHVRTLVRQAPPWYTILFGSTHNQPPLLPHTNNHTHTLSHIQTCGSVEFAESSCKPKMWTDAQFTITRHCAVHLYCQLPC